MSAHKQRNPWLTPMTPTEPHPEPAAPRPAPPTTTGPTHPQRGIPVPSRLLPIASRSTPAPLWILGVHGGAGETTIADLIPGAVAAGHAWPRLWDSSSRVLMTARSNAAGLHAAQAAAQQWASGHVDQVELIGLVILADAPGRLPRPLKDLADLVAGGVPRTWRIGWIDSWRRGEPAALDNAPRDVRHMVRDVIALTNPSPAGHQQKGPL